MEFAQCARSEAFNSGLCISNSSERGGRSADSHMTHAAIMRNLGLGSWSGRFAQGWALLHYQHAPWAPGTSWANGDCFSTVCCFAVDSGSGPCCIVCTILAVLKLKVLLLPNKLELISSSTSLLTVSLPPSVGRKQSIAIWILSTFLPLTVRRTKFICSLALTLVLPAHLFLPLLILMVVDHCCFFSLRTPILERSSRLAMRASMASI